MIQNIHDLIGGGDAVFSEVYKRFIDRLGVIQADRLTEKSLHSVEVLYNDKKRKLKGLATFVRKSATVIALEPWEKNKELIKAIRKSLELHSDLWNVSIENKIHIWVERLPLSLDYRKKLVKSMVQEKENAKILLRKERRKIIKECKDHFTKDDIDMVKKKLNKKIHKLEADIESLCKQKEKLLLSV